MNALVVRVARPVEWAAAGELAGAAYRAGGAESGYPETVRDSVSHPVAADHLLVALRDGDLIGTATLCPPGSKHAEIGRADEMEFRFVAVAPEARGTGVADALVDGVLRAADEAGARALVCCVMSTNEPAHRVYRRLGFERIPERDWWPIPEVELQTYCRPL